MKIKKILVAVDFSDFTSLQLDVATHIADKFPVSITMIHILPVDSSAASEFKQQLEQQKIFLKQQLQLHAGKKVQEINFVLKEGESPSDVINAHVQHHHYDLLIVGTHGHGGYQFLRHGSVAQKVVRETTIQVLTVPPIDKKLRFKRILVPIDFSLYSQAAVHFAKYLGKKFGGKLTFIHVIEQEIFPSYLSYQEESIFEVEPTLAASVEANMREFVSDFVEPNLVDDFVVVEGVIHKTISEISKDFDLLVLSRHGQSGLEFLDIGDSAEKIVQSALCPVWLLQP